jgi:hypothetical protein
MDDLRKCQTWGAAPAEPGDLPKALEDAFAQTFGFVQGPRSATFAVVLVGGEVEFRGDAPLRPRR